MMSYFTTIKSHLITYTFCYW